MNMLTQTTITLMAALAALACNSSAHTSEAGQVAKRATSPQAFVAQTLEVLRTADRPRWNGLLMSRSEYETRCPRLVKGNSPGWLDRRMKDRSDPARSPMKRCAKLAASTLAKVLFSQGGTPTRRLRMNECEGYEPRDPFRLIVELDSKERRSVRIDGVVDTRNGSWIPTGYVECNPSFEHAVACNKLARFVEDDPAVVSFSPFECGQVLEKEANVDAAKTKAVIACLEEAGDRSAAKACWANRSSAL